MVIEILLTLALYVAPVAWIAIRADRRGRSKWWVAWPALLGWIGWAVAFWRLRASGTALEAPDSD